MPLSSGHAPNILLANHTARQAHLGCRATCFAIEKMLRERLHPASVNYDEYDARRVPKSGNGLARRLKTAFLTDPKRSRQMRGSAEFSAYRDADLLVVNGEGSFYSDAWRKPHTDCHQRMRDIYSAESALQKPVWIVNHSLYSRHAGFDRWIQKIYRGAAHIAVREQDTFAYLQKLGVRNVQQAADAVFSLPPSLPATNSSWAGKVLITDTSAWPIHRLSPQHEPVRQLVVQLKSQGLEVAYLSIRTDHRDARIAEYLDLEFLYCTEFEDFMAQLQTARFLISGRFHVNVFAALCAVPFIAFEANTYKNKALNRLLLHPHDAFDFQHDTMPHILKSIERAMSDHKNIAQHLLAQRERLSALAWKNLPS